MSMYSSSEDLDATEKDAFISDQENLQSPRNGRKFGIWKWLTISFIALQSGIILFLGFKVVRNGIPSDLTCAKQLSPWSPYLDSNDLEYIEYTDRNHLMQPSKYRGKPTDEIEEAWLELWHLPTIHFPESGLDKLNKTEHAKYTHVLPEYGGEVLGFLDVFHQLHCLSMIRQYTYRNNYNYSHITAFVAPEEVLRGHVDHCIETLRKAITCTADVTPMVFLNDPSRPEGSKSDFNIRKKCRNITKIQEWARQNRGYSISPDTIVHGH